MEPLQNACWNKNVTEHKAPTYRRAADTDYANEGSTQPHYEPWREVVFLGYFLDEASLEVGEWVEVHGVLLQDCKGGGGGGVTRVNEDRAILYYM